MWEKERERSRQEKKREERESEREIETPVIQEVRKAGPVPSTRSRINELPGQHWSTLELAKSEPKLAKPPVKSAQISAYI